jgi:hypothetical protein
VNRHVPLLLSAFRDAILGLSVRLRVLDGSLRGGVLFSEECGPEDEFSVDIREFADSAVFKDDALHAPGSVSVVLALVAFG